MNSFPKKVWLLWRKLQFLLLPVERRVRLEVSIDGRHLTFLLVALEEAGFGVHVVRSPMVFRELLALRRSAKIPFIVGGRERKCGISIGEAEGRESLPSPIGQSVRVECSKRNSQKKILLNYDYFSPEREEVRMPYFMHPSVYHSGRHKMRNVDLTCLRRFRLGFFGTHDRDFYTRHYLFDGLNRFEIVEALLNRLRDRIAKVSGPPEHWPDAEIVVALDAKGGDRSGKAFLSQEDYLAALRECDFVISPPGNCMPVSHNLIEAVFCGAIPITNCPDYLLHVGGGKHASFAFRSMDEFMGCVEQALAMKHECIVERRREIADFYAQCFSPGSLAALIAAGNSRALLINAEEKSVSFRFPTFSWTPGYRATSY